MVVLEREIPAEADQVFAIVVDPHTYPHWLTGTKKIRDVDDGYPAPGLRFRHEVGMGPVTVHDSTRVDALGERHLELTVYARPLLVGRVRFDVGVIGPGRSSLRMEETAVGIYRWFRLAIDPLVRGRNTRSLDRLEHYVSDRVGP